MPQNSELPSKDRSGADGRIRVAVDGWKRKLLDLSGRNRALNFKPTKVSTITVIDEQPAEVFRRLYLLEQPMRFKAAPERDGATGLFVDDQSDRTSPAIDSEAEEDATPDVDFVPYDASALDERHLDGFLQTSARTDALDKSLRRIDEQARTSLEELGVNTLFLTLGMLHYKESADSEIMVRAPLILLPVQLDRKSARSGYALVATADEPLVNPALREYLKRSFGLSLPDVPFGDALPDDYDLQQCFEATREIVGKQQGWAVKADIFLGLFSFQKFVMYKDLESNGPAFVLHRLIDRLVTRTGHSVIGMPPEIREMNLDEQFPPEATSQVVDADSSQLRALAAVARGHDVVIEGPPGTGKSQTITNLIAQALAADKSVLFVAEKMAALQVVHSRLVQAGLGEFCLELHSTKAQKRRVIQSMASALDASLQSVAGPARSTVRLPQVRRSLNEYVDAVHKPAAALGISPYRGYGELGQVLGAVRVPWEGAVEDVSREQFDTTVRDLRDLATHAEQVGELATHPWRDATKTFYSPGALEDIERQSVSVLQSLNALIVQAQATGDVFASKPVESFADVDVVFAVAGAIEKSPGAPVEVLANEAWNAAPAEATELVLRVRRLTELKTDLLTRVSGEAFESDHAPDIDYVEAKLGGFFGFLAMLDGRYRAIRKRWNAYRRSTEPEPLLEQAKDLRAVDRYRTERAVIEGFSPQGKTLFGALWTGTNSDVSVLERYIEWVVGFRGICLRHGLSRAAIELASKPNPDTSSAQRLQACSAAAKQAIGELNDAVGWSRSYLEEDKFAEIVGRISNLCERLSSGPGWAAFEESRQVVSSGLAAELLPKAMVGEIACRDLAPGFQRAFLMKWLSLVVGDRPPLAKFHSLTHEERVSEFRELDRRVLLENRAALVSQLRDSVQHKLQQPAAAAALPFLQREMAKQRNLSPLRRTVREAEAAIRAIKPCFLMSPLTVAQYIRGGEPAFDLVIFDEASQLPPEDAVGAVVRGRQLAVVGDPKQLPPTSFFNSSLDPSELYAPDGTPIYQDAESVLEEFMGAGLPMTRLKWHYRSAHESLITFSNVSFYDADLYTFPSAEIGVGRHGLSFEFVDGGTYEGKGLNAVEARRVADEVVQFAREQLARREAGEKMASLGVGTFNLRQQVAIQDELEVRRRADPRIESFFDRGLDEPFFVKNLENIQGDERDIIFLSVTYARGIDGQLRYNFGPLNGQNGWRRLNVLTTRARRQMRVFSSMRGDEISPAATASEGPRLLREFLSYAEHGRLDSKLVHDLGETESPFEREVLIELTRRGIKVVPQVGAAGYRIDIGVLDDEVPGRFVCGIECDGVAYHSSESARDRDRLRHQVLERRGWYLIRVWSTDWFKDRAGQVTRLLQTIDIHKKSVRDQVVAEGEARRQGIDAVASPEQNSNPDDPGPAVFGTPKDSDRVSYQRPTAPPYRFAPREGRFVDTDILRIPDPVLSTAIQTVIDIEAPIHVVELMTRVATMWGNKAGSRIQARIQEVASRLIGHGTARRRGDFYWGSADSCVVRSRAMTRISADRIAPEEFDQTILVVLQSGHSLTRPLLTAEVRAVLGYSRTGAIIEEAVSDAVTRLLASGQIGEGSSGLILRRTS